MKIVINYKLNNWNEIIDLNRKNKYLANNEKQVEMGYIKYFLIGIEKIKEYPIELICKWHIKNSNSDLDNKSIKSVLDALQLYGILENDNCKHINKITYEYIEDKKDYLEIEVRNKTQ